MCAAFDIYAWKQHFAGSGAQQASNMYHSSGPAWTFCEACKLPYLQYLSLCSTSSRSSTVLPHLLIDSEALACAQNAILPLILYHASRARIFAPLQCPQTCSWARPGRWGSAKPAHQAQ
jgi:hypothetical protein